VNFQSRVKIADITSIKQTYRGGQKVNKSSDTGNYESSWQVQTPLWYWM